MGSGQSLEDLVFDLNMSGKQLARDAAKSVREADAARASAKKFMVDNRTELAQQQAQLCVVKEKQAVRFQQMST